MTSALGTRRRRRYRRNPKIDWTLVLLIGVGWYAYKKGWLKSLLGDVGDQVGNPPPGGALTYEQACAQAKAWLCSQSSQWCGASCEQVKAKVCSDPTIFVAPNPVRTALGC